MGLGLHHVDDERYHILTKEQYTKTNIWIFGSLIFFFLRMFYDGHRTVFKKDPKSSSGFSEDRKSFSFDTPSTREYYEKDIVELSYSFSTYMRNNIKKISSLPVDLWKIEIFFPFVELSYSFSTYTSPRHITTTNNKTRKPPPTLLSNGGRSQNCSWESSSSSARDQSTIQRPSIND